jgi:hypothetical protein
MDVDYQVITSKKNIFYFYRTIVITNVIIPAKFYDHSLLA